MVFRSVSSGNSDSRNWGQVNDVIRQLSNEQVTKAFKQTGGNSIVTGKLPATNSYGTLVYDSDNLARILIGTYDNRVGIWVSKDGVDVLTELGA